MGKARRPVGTTGGRPPVAPTTGGGPRIKSGVTYAADGKKDKQMRRLFRGDRTLGPHGS